jgi:hypothetical protein
MNDAFAVQMVHCVDQRLHYTRHVFLITTQLGHQLASFYIFHQEEDMVIITEVPIEHDHIRVIQHIQ